MPLSEIITVKDVASGREWKAISQQVMDDMESMRKRIATVAIELDTLYEGLDTGAVSQMEIGLTLADLSRKLRGLE